MNVDEPGLRRIGFGCSHITAGFEARSNHRLLRLAYDFGIRHFDTAPLYGHGTSEEVVGTAFRRDRHNVTIATKVGIPHGKLSFEKRLVRLAAAPIRRWISRLSKFAAKKMYSAEASTDFSPLSIDKSVETSLTNLRTDYIDILLLHEVRLADISDELMQKLQTLVQAGKVRRLGIGTTTERIVQINGAGIDFEVYQRPWSIFVPDEMLFAHHYQIFHGSILGAIEKVRDRILANPASRDRLQALTGLECQSSDDIAKVLLLSAIAANPRGLVLFSSRLPLRVSSYLKFAQEFAGQVGPDWLQRLRKSVDLAG